MIRKDSWSPYDDATLAEAVLRHVRNGSTQLKAFEEVSVALGRSSIACGFRWNSEVRKVYRADLIAAKDTRNGKNPEAIASHHETPSELIDEPINEPVKATQKAEPFKLIDAYLNEIKAEMTFLKQENEILRGKLAESPENSDLNTLMSLIQHARELGLLSDTESPAAQ